MADVTRNDKGEIVKVSYVDNAGYTAEVDLRSPISGRVRIVSKAPGGTGSPADLTRSEARKYARDILDLVGHE
jgi:hypothetical protein